MIEHTHNPHPNNDNEDYDYDDSNIHIAGKKAKAENRRNGKQWRGTNQQSVIPSLDGTRAV